MRVRPSGIQRGRNSDAPSNETRDSGPRGSCFTQMSSPVSVARPMATRVPSGESAQPTLPPKKVNRNSQSGSTGISRPVRSTQTSSYRRASPSVEPWRITSVPEADRAASGFAPSSTAMPSMMGTDAPVTFRVLRSNGAASIAPSLRM
ncbi:MAG: hypothetical protein IPK12_19345 [Gemmatimonadetes bacterium]|nr:hypothetical protein [Gemmatimonadota bacterium]